MNPFGSFGSCAMSAKSFTGKKPSFDGTLFGGRRKRTEHRYKLNQHRQHLEDEKRLRRYAGHVLSAETILKLFGYSPTTYINDTRLVRNKLIRKLRNGKFKVTGLNERTGK